MVFDLQTLKSCGFKVFNFVEDNDKPALPHAADRTRRPRLGAKGARRMAAKGGDFAGCAPRQA